MKKTVCYNEKLKNDLRAYLNVNNMSYREFSRKSGVSSAIISEFFAGKYSLGMKSMGMIINAIGKSEDDYIRDDDWIVKIYNEVDFNELSIDELDVWIEKLQRLRRGKIAANIKEHEVELQKLNDLLRSEES